MVKRLERFPKRGKIAGVCEGLGEYFEMDPVILRIVFLLLLLVVGGGLITYIVFWIIMPKSPADFEVSL